MSLVCQPVVHKLCNIYVSGLCHQQSDCAVACFAAHSQSGHTNNHTWAPSQAGWRALPVTCCGQPLNHEASGLCTQQASFSHCLIVLRLAARAPTSARYALQDFWESRTFFKFAGRSSWPASSIFTREIQRVLLEVVLKE